MRRTPRTDSEIQLDVIRELKWDTRVKETEVGVVVDHGIVTLSGTVNSWAKRIAAKEAAHRVRGVRDVANEVEVHLPGAHGRTDAEVAGAVRHALAWDVFVPHDAITSTVTRAWVTLEGRVESWNQRDAAERAILNLVGVQGVTNKLEVAPPPALSLDVRAAIETALERRAEREACRIDGEVADGHVTLSGRVHSFREKQAVLGAAKGTAGVRVVEDLLEVADELF
jgi:osmotically-inducible protein OsmY